MRSRRAAFALLGLALGAGAPRADASPPNGAPDAVIDLASADGAAQVDGRWRYRDVRITEATHRLPGPDGQPTGAETRTYDLIPHAGTREFDDSEWEVVPADSLSERRGHGRLSFNWYRIRVTIPERIGSFDPEGSSVVFETVLDDYAEIWVDGELARAPGQQGGTVIAGWNAPNRVVVARRVRPGQQFQLAVFGANGPLSDPPANFIWVRSARLLFYREGLPAPVAVEPQEVNVAILERDPALRAIVPPNPKLYKLAEGFEFIEGPVWLPDGRLLFSDPNANRIYRYDPRGRGTLSVFRDRSGYDGADLAEYGQPGSNGLTLDRSGRLTICEHGNRRVTRLESDGQLTVLADRYQGQRLNSPNDLVYRSDGTLYFSDPPFGLPRFYDDPRKELPFSGVFALRNGTLRLVGRELAGPNGLAFSPDEKVLYVDNWDVRKKVVMRYDVAPDGALSSGRVFFDMTLAPGEEALDGLKVDQQGNVYVSGPGGVWILSAQGKHLGTIQAPRLPANFAWGDDDGRTLYLTARTTLYQMRLGVAGVRP